MMRFCILLLAAFLLGAAPSFALGEFTAITATGTITGGTVNSTGALQTGGVDRIDASGNITATAGSFSGNVTYTGAAQSIDFRFENAATDSRTDVGAAYYDTDDNHPYVYNGTAFQKLFLNVAGDEATGSARGLMSASDKTSLTNLAARKAGVITTAGNATSGTLTFGTAFGVNPITVLTPNTYNMAAVTASITSSFDWGLEANPSNALIYWQSEPPNNP